MESLQYRVPSAIGSPWTRSLRRHELGGSRRPSRQVLSATSSAIGCLLQGNLVRYEELPSPNHETQSPHLRKVNKRARYRIRSKCSLCLIPSLNPASYRTMRHLRVARAMVWLGTRGALCPPPIMLRRPVSCRRTSASGYTHRAKRALANERRPAVARSDASGTNRLGPAWMKTRPSSPTQLH